MANNRFHFTTQCNEHFDSIYVQMTPLKKFLQQLFQQPDERDPKLSGETASDFESRKGDQTQKRSGRFMLHEWLHKRNF